MINDDQVPMRYDTDESVCSHDERPVRCGEARYMHDVQAGSDGYRPIIKFDTVRYL